MNALDIMKRPAAYVSGYENTPHGGTEPCKATVLGVQPHRSQRTGKAAQHPADLAGHLFSHDRNSTGFPL